jgi:hypothetical protein
LRAAGERKRDPRDRDGDAARQRRARGRRRHRGGNCPAGGAAGVGDAPFRRGGDARGPRRRAGGDLLRRRVCRPGSFTGLRVGMAAAKGYCFGWGRPIALVPTLEALASRFPEERRVLCPVLDARKKEVYAALLPAGGRLAPAPVPRPRRPSGGADRPPAEGEIVFCGDGLKSYGPMLLDRLGNGRRSSRGRRGCRRRGPWGPRRADPPPRRVLRPALGGSRVCPAFRGGVQAPPLLKGSKPGTPFISGGCKTPSLLVMLSYSHFFPWR